MKWYAVMTAPRGEELANRNLKRAGYFTFYPFYRVRRRRKRANVDQYLVEWIDMPYYSRYIFVGLRDGEGLYGVNEADGVATVVHNKAGPLEIPHSVMDELMSLGDSRGQVGTRDDAGRRRFMPGQHVRISGKSPLDGLVAQIALDNGREIRVWLSMLGAKRQVIVDPQAVVEIAS
jgi:transcription antitermination factor NusG